eukprot:1158843-Pelagomonas_calceolata.AAC.4
MLRSLSSGGVALFLGPRPLACVDFSFLVWDLTACFGGAALEGCPPSEARHSLSIAPPGKISKAQQGPAKLSRVQHSLARLSKAQQDAAKPSRVQQSLAGSSKAQQGPAKLSRMQQSLAGSSKACQDAAKLSRMQQSSAGCSKAQQDPAKPSRMQHSLAVSSKAQQDPAESLAHFAAFEELPIYNSPPVGMTFPAKSSDSAGRNLPQLGRACAHTLFSCSAWLVMGFGAGSGGGHGGHPAGCCVGRPHTHA